MLKADFLEHFENLIKKFNQLTSTVIGSSGKEKNPEFQNLNKLNHEDKSFCFVTLNDNHINH